MDLLKAFTWSLHWFKVPPVSDLLLFQKIAANGTNVAERRLKRALVCAKAQQFSQAIALLEKIPPNSSVYLEARKNLLEYREAYHLQSQRWFERAVLQSSRNNFSEAIRLLRQIPPKASIYAQAQATLAEYQRTIEQIYLRGGSAGIR
ncbi:hypothetical protein [Stenomitos frigidus]|uniref:Uncharacterized protein n=1 Tax=Stenomitos frigidus ULC18 TaxID=2107698 RepID=A0A2T1EL41_9CYAN|nr:hypothetical protein [Stenomitos frigidus]PSB33415.1 hypothetical protein C7B82_04520 [Stenomitos frigidus ULC18]